MSCPLCAKPLGRYCRITCGTPECKRELRRRRMNTRQDNTPCRACGLPVKQVPGAGGPRKVHPRLACRNEWRRMREGRANNLSNQQQ